VDDGHDAESVARELAGAVGRANHAAANHVGMARGVLEMLSESPGLDEDERALIDRAIARLDALADEIHELTVLIRRLGLADRPGSLHLQDRPPAPQSDT
jgi:hypothetical protein